MLSALNFLSTLQKNKKLNACPIFIGPNTDLVDVSLRLIEKNIKQSIETLTAKDSAAFFSELQLSHGQQNFFSARSLTFLTGCSSKFLEKTLSYDNIFKTNFILHAPKLPYKSPLISQLEKSGRFIVLTCFNPTPQELLKFAESYLDTKSNQLITLFPKLPPSLPELIDELDKINLLGFEDYQPNTSPRDEAIDTICFHLLSGSAKASQKMATLFQSENTDPTFFLKSLLFQLNKFKAFLGAARHERITLRLSKLMTTRFETLSKYWSLQKIKALQAKLFDLEHQMRLNHEIAPLLLENSLTELFIIKPSFS